MKLNKKMVGAGALAAAGAVTAGVYLVKRKVSKSNNDKPKTEQDTHAIKNESQPYFLSPDEIYKGDENTEHLNIKSKYC